jgi:hypothetical protein
VQLSDKVGRLGRLPEPAEVPVATTTRRAQDTGRNGAYELGKSPTPRITMKVTREKVRKRETEREGGGRLVAYKPGG